MKIVEPVLLGLLWGVYQEYEVSMSDCSWTEWKLISIHLTKQNAENSIK